MISQTEGVFHIWTRDDIYRDLLEDILADSARDVLIGINFNTAPFPLLSFGRRNTAWSTYLTYANIYSPHFWRRIYLESMETTKDPPLFEVERSRVNFNIRVYPNF